MREVVLTMAEIVEFKLVTYDNGRYKNIKCRIPKSGERPKPESMHYANFENVMKALNNMSHTYFVTHGFHSSSDGIGIKNIINRLAAGKHGNVIGVNWSKLAKGEYLQTAKRTVALGRHIARFIDLMHEIRGIHPENITLIGHSLGAHTSGFIGRSVKSGKIHRIDGLDPAGPYFNRLEDTDRLNRSDASFVNVLHTDTKYFGTLLPLGHVDFLVNGGRSQPLCNKPADVAGCSHNFATIYYFRSINENYYAAKCKSYEKFRKNKCPVDKNALMGFKTSPNLNGIYYVSLDE